VEATAMNEVSSRSHTVFMLYVVSTHQASGTTLQVPCRCQTDTNKHQTATELTPRFHQALPNVNQPVTNLQQTLTERSPNFRLALQV
jgi:hypothetical protein